MGFCLGIRRAVGRASTSGVQSLRSAWPKVLAGSGSAALAKHRTTGLSAVAATVLLSWTPLLSLDIVISGTSLRADAPMAVASRELPPQPTWPLSNSQDLLAMDPSAFVQFLKTARPEPVSAEDKARALFSLPEEGEVTNLNAAARLKLAALVEVLRATDRDSVYVIKVMAVPLAAIAMHARAIILISEPALTLLDADELQALVAHEVGHEYVWAERERSFRLADRSRLKDLELMCDAIAIVTLHGLGMDVSRLMTGLEKISHFNRKRFGTADNEKDYPTVAERGAFTRAVATWTSARTGAR